jgi:F-type H+-transporting ATPase subunit b
VLASSNFLVPNLTFVVELAAFLVVLGVLWKYILPPIQKAMNDRQETIRQSLVDAETAKQRAAEAEIEYRRILDDARAQARATVDEANRMAEDVRASRRAEADREYQQIIERATADIDAAARRASEDLRRQSADLVIAVVEKVVAGLDAQTHRDLINRTIAEVEAASGASTAEASR